MLVYYFKNKKNKMKKLSTIIITSSIIVSCNTGKQETNNSQLVPTLWAEKVFHLSDSVYNNMSEKYELENSFSGEMYLKVGNNKYLIIGNKTNTSISSFENQNNKWLKIKDGDNDTIESITVEGASDCYQTYFIVREKSLIKVMKKGIIQPEGDAPYAIPDTVIFEVLADTIK